MQKNCRPRSDYCTVHKDVGVKRQALTLFTCSCMAGLCLLMVVVLVIKAKCKQEEKILNEPAAIYWFNEILLVILSKSKVFMK